MSAVCQPYLNSFIFVEHLYPRRKRNNKFYCSGKHSQCLFVHSMNSFLIIPRASTFRLSSYPVWKTRELPPIRLHGWGMKMVECQGRPEKVARTYCQHWGMSSEQCPKSLMVKLMGHRDPHKDRTVHPGSYRLYICIYIYICILFHFQASKFSMYVGIAISTLPTGIATVPDKHAHVSYSPLQTHPYTRQFHTPIIVQDHFTLITRGFWISPNKGIFIMIWSIIHWLVHQSSYIVGGGATFMASVFRWYRTPSGLSWTMFPKKHQHQPDQPVTGSRHRLMRGNHLSSENLQCHSMSLIDW